MLQIKLFEGSEMSKLEKEVNDWLGSREAQKAEILGTNTEYTGTGDQYGKLFKALITITYDDEPVSQADMLKEVSERLGPPRPPANPTPIR